MAFALSDILNPESVFVAGGYYGYWAIWIMPGIADDARVVLSDINPEVSSLSEKNVGKMCFADNSEVYCQDAEKLLMENEKSLDMMLLDATGKYDDPRPQYRGKSIYGPLAEAGLSRMKSGGILLAHNIKPEDEDLDYFFEVINKNCSLKLEYPTTCGVGIYIKK